MVQTNISSLRREGEQFNLIIIYQINCMVQSLYSSIYSSKNLHSMIMGEDKVYYAMFQVTFYHALMFYYNARHLRERWHDRDRVHEYLALNSFYFLMEIVI